MEVKDIRALAVYLPQFHPIPENDEWWGKGFTEWRNVAKAKPRFEGHYQPHMPADMGYYDLRLNDTLIEQARLAGEHGIHGFCFYHYWFTGKTLLETPLELMLKSGKPDFPFCLCWANENWTRRWDGMDHEVLMKQEYSDSDDRAHIQYLKDFFLDERYIRIQGKPVFIVYRPSLFPDFKRSVEIWRETAKEIGIGEIYVAYFQSFGNKTHPEELGCDAAVEFQPDFWDFVKSDDQKKIPSITERIFRKLGLEQKQNPDQDKIYHYPEIIRKMRSRITVDYKRFPAVFPMWDNTARRAQNATIILDSTPEDYRDWLMEVVKSFKPFSSDENLLFINAWNEWAEGNHIEPCLKWGRKYLEATKAALNGR